MNWGKKPNSKTRRNRTRRLHRNRTRKHRGGSTKPVTNVLNLKTISDANAKARIKKFRTERDLYLQHGKQHTNAKEIDVCVKKKVKCGPFPRYIMPQIDDLDEFLRDADEFGIPMTYTRETRTLDEIRPSQSEALQSRVNDTATAIQQDKSIVHKDPIIISKDGDIIDGHHRFFALKQLGRTKEDIPVRVIDADRDTILEASAAVGLEHAPRKGWSGLNPGGI